MNASKVNNLRLCLSVLSKSKHLESINSSRFYSKVTSHDKNDWNVSTYTNKIVSYTNTSTAGFNLLTDTIGDLIRKAANETPSDVGYIFPHNGGLKLTYLELLQRVQKMAESLSALGFKKGDRLAVILPNTHEFLITHFACAMLGVITVSLNPLYQIVEIEYSLKKTKAKGVVFYDSFRILKHYDIIKGLCPELDECCPGELKSKRFPDLKHVIIINSPLEATKKSYKGTWSYDLLAESKITNKTVEYPTLEAEDPTLILFTSGTTGFPKGVALRPLGTVNCPYYAGLTAFGKNDGLKTTCLPIPLFHLFGYAMGVIPPLTLKNTTVFSFYLPDTLASMKAIQAYKCHTYLGPPTLFVDLLSHPERKNYDLSSLKNTLIGASTVPPDLLEKMKSELNLEKVVVGYGMTETSLLATMTYASDAKKSYKHAYESIGRVIPFLEAKIINPETKRTVPLNTDGELCLRGFNTIKSYWEEPEKSSEAIDENGWLRTGDVCSMDEQGYIFFKSRSKDVIIRGGTNIYPSEVEAFLRTNNNLIDAVVFGVPDSRLGEDVAVWVKVKPNCTFTHEDLKQFCTDKIANFKIPRYFKIVDSFPTNPNGKITRNVIVQKAKAEWKL